MGKTNEKESEKLEQVKAGSEMISAGWPLNWVICCYEQICYPQHSYIEAPVPSLSVSGNRNFREVIRVTWGKKGGSLILRTGVSL